MARSEFKERLKLRFNTEKMDKIIVALLNAVENKKFISNISKLFSQFSESSFINDYEKELRVYVIRKISSVIIERNLKDKNSVLYWLSLDGKYAEDVNQLLNNLQNCEMADEELHQIDKMISGQLKFGYLESRSSELIDCLTNLANDNYADFDKTLTDAVGKIEQMNKDLRASAESIEDSKREVSLNSDNFVGTLRKIIDQERNPATKIKSGIRAFNDMLNGGFERGRLYLACGCAKGWKSGFLLKMAKDAKKYNQLATHDASKKPVILYLTMENNLTETITRIWASCFGDDCPISKYSETEAASMLEKAGIFSPADENAPELKLMYRSCRSINTNDLRGVLDDYLKDGKECVFLVFDYVKRIKSISKHADQRLELGAIVDELTSIAKDYDIPILSAHQLNRESFRALEQASSFEEKLAATDKLGVSNIADSIDIIQNCDFAFIINRIENRETNEKNELEFSDRFLTIKTIASRTKESKYTSIRHRFRDGNGMDLIDDINMPYPISSVNDADILRDRMKNHPSTTRGKRTIVSQ